MLTKSQARAFLSDVQLSVVSRRTQVSRNTLYCIMKGSNPGADTLEKITEYKNYRDRVMMQDPELLFREAW